MRRCHVNLTSFILRSFICFQLLPIVFSCIYLLNGWMPMSVYNRTAKADIVLSAHVLHTFKDKEFRTEAQTYMTTIKVFDVYKGRKLLRNISVSEDNPKVYNVTNFGDRKMCYADVMAGQNYILFLTTYKQRLSAKYDDIFGAATRFTESNVREIEARVGSGLGSWTGWSPCSHSCEGGYQARKRACKKGEGKCVREVIEKRSCNTFACKGSHDVLSYLNVYKLPLGVFHVHNRPGAFNVTSHAKLFTPLSDIYSDYLPHDFAVLFSVKFSRNYSGYLLTLSDLLGNQRLAIKFTKTGKSGKVFFEYYDKTGSTLQEISREFKFELIDDSWHQYALSINGDNVGFYLDCTKVASTTFERSVDEHLNSNLMLALGPYFARYGTYFEGEIEQLTLVSDPTAASDHCSSVYEERAIKDEENTVIDGTEDNNTTKNPEKPTPITALTTQLPSPTKQPDVTAQWTEWSPCSHTCGRGVQVRAQYCGNDIISNCKHADLATEEMRWCFHQSCTAMCYPECKNGGLCTKFGKCVCPEGFTGKSCDKAICEPGCLNGGRCTGPGECKCPIGYTGTTCESAICMQPCQHGGRCIEPNYCSCPYGYMPPSCEPICLLPCRNGGRCVRHNKCKCPKGYRGRDCSEPICRRGCFNGGRCVAPNMCTCPHGYSGTRCHKPVCKPSCQNKGRCLYPGVCHCKRGYSGSLCEIAGCKRTCKNGGFCSGKNQCACPPGYRGRWCHKKIYKNSCQTTCFNGGRCRKKRCQCRPGYSGKRCERQDCTFEAYLIPYTQTYRKLQRRDVVTLCEMWNRKTCNETRFEYVLATRTLYRNGYRCV